MICINFIAFESILTYNLLNIHLYLGLISFKQLLMRFNFVILCLDYVFELTQYLRDYHK